jgi:putative IMPACT (imprinted ancient) family translation regulator
MHPDAYAVLADAGSAELKVKGSRFLALALPVADAAAARRERAALALAHPDASHHCWALRLGPPASALARADDAGEPGGSAGAPIARALVAAGVSDALCVVLRWFGGTKLGLGGLIRAYGEVARAALAVAPRAERLALLRLAGSFPYALEPALRALLEAQGGCLLASRREAAVTWRFALPPSALAPFNAKAADLLRGPTPFTVLAAPATDED